MKTYLQTGATALLALGLAAPLLAEESKRAKREPAAGFVAVSPKPSSDHVHGVAVGAAKVEASYRTTAWAAPITPNPMENTNIPRSARTELIPELYADAGRITGKSKRTR